MTVSNENAKDVSVVGAATPMVLSYTFDAVQASDVFVELFDNVGASKGITWTRVTGSPTTNQYSVDVDASQVTFGGAASFLQDEYGSDVAEVVIFRELPLTQTVALTPAVALDVKNIEKEFDRGKQVDQQIQEQLNRTVQLTRNNDASSAVVLPDADVGKTLIWDANGNLENTANTLINESDIDIPSIVPAASGAGLIAKTDLTGYEFSAQNSPVGTIILHAGAATLSSYLDCDGSAISRAVFSELFAAIGTVFGVGDGSTTYNLPDLRGRAPIGVGTGAGLTARALGDVGGEEDHQLTEAELAAHDHDLNVYDAALGNAPLDTALSFAHQDSAGSNYGQTNAGNQTNSSPIADAGSDTAHENMPPFLAIRYLIRYESTLPV